MKKKNTIKHILLATVLLGSTVSCEDHLTTPPNDQLATDGFYETPAQINQGIVGIYAGLNDLSHLEYLYMSECRSDNTWVEPRPNGIRQYSEFGTFRATNDLTELNDVWNKWYKIIYDANIILSKIDDVDFDSREERKAQFLGEAHFMRGWAYLELVRLFGNIPLIDYAMSSAEVQEVGQSTPKEIYESIIIPDLIKARDNLPVKSDMVDASGKSVAGVRADRTAAQAMLGRAYLTMAGFPVNDSSAKSLAATELKSVIDYADNNGLYWAPDSTEWRKQWIPTTDYYNKYSILAIQHRANSGSQIPFLAGPKLPPSHTSFSLFDNSIYVEKTLMYEFDKVYSGGNRDARGHNYSILTGYDEEPNYPAYTQMTSTITGDEGTQVEVYTRSMFFKFFPSKVKLANLGLSIDIEGNMTENKAWPVNTPIIRLEDVMLMYAEILSETDPAGAVAYVNKIRERAGCDPVTASTSAQALEYVKRERRIELMGEGVRWFDIVRWGEWQTNIVNMFNSYNNPDGTDVNNVKDGRYLYAIPLNQMNAKPGLYTQNPGY